MEKRKERDEEGEKIEEKDLKALRVKKMSMRKKISERERERERPPQKSNNTNLS